MSELHRQRLLQRIVKDRIAGGVGEVGEDDGVLLGQRRCWTRAEVETTTNQGGDDDHRSRNQNLPELPATGCRNFGDLRRTR